MPETQVSCNQDCRQGRDCNCGSSELNWALIQALAATAAFWLVVGGIIYLLVAQ